MVFPGRIEGDIIACIRMSDNTHTGVITQDPRKTGRRLRGAIGDDDHTRMDTVSHAYSTPMVETYPAGTASGIDKGIKQGPVRDRIAAILHGFRFPVRAGDRTGVQVITTDDDRSFYLAGAY